MPMDDLLQAVPKLISRVDSLEMDLKQTKLTMGNAIVKLVKKCQDDPQDSSIQGLVTPPTTKVHASGEEQVEDISPNTLEAAKTLSKVASLKSRSIDKGRRYKRRKETKTRQYCLVKDKGTKRREIARLSEETPKKSKEQILQEEASLAEAIRLDSLQEEERLSKLHFGCSHCTKNWRRKELTEQTEKAKLEANAELSKSMLGSELQGEDFAKRMVDLVNQRKKLFAEERAKAKRNKPMTQSQLKTYMMNYLKNQGTWKITQLKKLNFEEVKEEFDKLVKQIESFAPISFEATKASLKRFGEELQTKTPKRLKEEKDDEAKDDESTKKSGKRRKQMARKGMNTNVDENDSEDSSISRDDLTELYRIVMNRYGVDGPEDKLEKGFWKCLRIMFEEPLSTDSIWSEIGQQKIISWRYYDTCRVHCLNLESMDVYMLSERKYPLSAEFKIVLMSESNISNLQNLSFKLVQDEKEAIDTIDEGQINWVEQTTDEELNHALMAFTVNNEVSMCSKLCLDSYNALQAKYDELQSEFGDQEAALVAHKLIKCFEQDEKLKKYRRIGMKAVKDKDALQKIVDSWFASSKNLWKLIDCGMSSTVKLGLGHSIKSNAEVLGYEEEMSRLYYLLLRETDEGYYYIPLYSSIPNRKNTSDGELRIFHDASSTHYSTCQSNDSDGELGTVSDHSVNDASTNDHNLIPSIEQVTIATKKTQPQVPKPQQTVDPSCAQHVKTPRQPIRTPVTPSPIPSYNRQNRNQGMQRDLGTGYSFERKPCFVCGSLSHLIKDCDYYEKKMAREAAFKSTRVVHANVRQATPAWTNSNRVNKANQFTPRPVQLNNIRPNLSTASKTIKTGRVNVNTGHGNVSSVSSAGTQFKSGASRFNTGKQHVNSGSVHVNSGTQFKSGASRFNTGKQHVNSGSVHVNSGTQFKSGASRFNTGKQHVSSGY
ncbi:hypothetical protein Tco_1484371 [Tanacetum coccineum]